MIVTPVVPGTTIVDQRGDADLDYHRGRHHEQLRYHAAGHLDDCVQADSDLDSSISGCHGSVTSNRWRLPFD